MAITDPLVESLQRDGFVVVRGLLQGDDLKRMQEAALRTAKKAREGDWPTCRIVGKQFPPWPAWTAEAAAEAAAKAGKDGGSGGIWGVQHLMKPELGEDAAIFTQSYFATGGVLDVAKRLLPASGSGVCTDDELVMELYNMLIRPDYLDYELRWHRDDIPAEATAEEELDRLNKPAYHAQWNLALFDDRSLVVVPGSHARARTDGERSADPFAAQLPEETNPPEGYRPQLTVHLRPGDCAFYNNNILHRGVYQTAVERATLHGSVGHIAGSSLRARNVMQHGVGDWIERADFSRLSAPERKRAEGMRARLVSLGQAAGKTGYSHAD